ncbi:MAG TPA: NUDIX hydrolase [Methylovirgula sp.]|nr:NUDIX hydrolase [Methylovirgula sp.]
MSRFDPPYPLLGVSIAVFRGGRVLLAKRTAPPSAGAFSLPGGRVEAGESLEDAALRELEEETGVEARIIGFNRAVEMMVADTATQLRQHYVVLSFVGLWISGEGQTGPEASEILWAEPHEIARLTTTPHLHAIVENAQKILLDRNLA